MPEADRYDVVESETLTRVPSTPSGQPGRFGLFDWPVVGYQPTCSLDGVMRRFGSAMGGITGIVEWWRCEPCNLLCAWDRVAWDTLQMRAEATEGLQGIICDLTGDCGGSPSPDE